jgi:hypothetical protein
MPHELPASSVAKFGISYSPSPSQNKHTIGFSVFFEKRGAGKTQEFVPGSACCPSSNAQVAGKHHNSAVLSVLLLVQIPPRMLSSITFLLQPTHVESVFLSVPPFNHFVIFPSCNLLYITSQFIYWRQQYQIYDFIFTSRS